MKSRIFAWMLAVSFAFSNVNSFVFAEEEPEQPETTEETVKEEETVSEPAEETEEEITEEEPVEETVSEEEEQQETEAVPEETFEAEQTPEEIPVAEKEPEVTEDEIAEETEVTENLQSVANIDDNPQEVVWGDPGLPASVDNTNVGLRSKVYLAVTDEGYVRVVYDGEQIVIENYDSSFNMLEKGKLAMELPVWGGFFKGEDAYYIVEGQNNKDGVDGTEVLRIIKYDHDWNRLGSGSILAKEGWEYEIRYPFDHSCVNMTEVNGKLYVITGRQGYVDPNYNQGHQGMMLIRMDENTFDSEIVYGDFWHSFSQHIVNNGSDLYILECSEGSRYTCLSRFDSNRTGTDYFDAFEERFSVLDYGGSRDSAWAISCYASADDIAVSDRNVLGLGTSIDQSQYDNADSSTSHNIYLTVTPLSSLNKESTTVKWLTDYSSDGKSFYGVNITKVNDDRFMVLWEEFIDATDEVTVDDLQDPLSAGTIHYMFVDGDGNPVSEEYTARAMISDCRPVLSGDQIVYTASNGIAADFYTIDAYTGAFTKTVRRSAGEDITWDLENGVLTFSGTGEFAFDTEAEFRYPVSSTRNSYSYSSADNCWTFLRDSVTEMHFGEGITSIPAEGFAYFEKLKTVDISEGMESIGEKAFYSCSALRHITIPDSVTEIGSDILWTGYTWIGSGGHVVYATIHGGCSSYAKEYAETNEIRYNMTHHGLTETEAVPAVCEKDGNTAYWTCGQCGKVFSDSEGTKETSLEKTVIPAIGHKWGKWTVTTKPTCLETGEETRTCANDPSHQETREVKELGHDPVKVKAADAGCESEGNIEYWKCSRCGELFRDEAGTEEISEEDTVLPPLGHHIVKLEAKSATSDETGNIECWICDRCGKHFADENGTEELADEEWQIPKLEKPKSITLDLGEYLEMPTNAFRTFTATVSPEGADDRIIWTSSNTKAAGFITDGVLAGRTYGKTTITATSAADPSIKATCVVQVWFEDVLDPSLSYYKPVYWGADNGVVAGYDGGVYFGPDNDCTRAQFVTFLWRLAGRQTGDKDVSFPDVDPNESYYRAVKWAVSKGIIVGYKHDNGPATFEPDGTVTRGQVATMLWRFARRKTPELPSTSPFSDIDASNSSYRAVVWGQKAGVIKGYKDGTFQPDASCLRQHIVTFLYRYARDVMKINVN